MSKETTRQEAAYYTEIDGYAICALCPHQCVIEQGRTGLCGVRGNDNGILYADSYGQISSIGLDPIEKKPLYHFYPGSIILSVGNYGCNLRCAFCQNHAISMIKPPRLTRGTAYQSPAERTRRGSDSLAATPSALTPVQLAALAEQYVPEGNIGVAYTYNEPLIGYEYVRDCAIAVHKKGMKNILVTNGYIEAAPFAALLPYIDALNIDLKGFNEPFYQKLKGGLETVKQSITQAAAQAHVEVTTLVIPGENDSEEEMQILSEFLAAINPKIPLHLSRFFRIIKCWSVRRRPKKPCFGCKRWLRSVWRMSIWGTWGDNTKTCEKGGWLLLSHSPFSLS